MLNASLQWDGQLNRYVSKVIECLEKTFENKLIVKDHQRPSKWADYKIFELKYGKTKLLGNTKHNQVKLVLADSFLLICTNIASNYIKQTWYN